MSYQDYKLHLVGYKLYKWVFTNMHNLQIEKENQIHKKCSWLFVSVRSQWYLYINPEVGRVFSYVITQRHLAADAQQNEARLCLVKGCWSSQSEAT